MKAQVFKNLPESRGRSCHWMCLNELLPEAELWLLLEPDSEKCRERGGRARIQSASTMFIDTINSEPNTRMVSLPDPLGCCRVSVPLIGTGPSFGAVPLHPGFPSSWHHCVCSTSPWSQGWSSWGIPTSPPGPLSPPAETPGLCRAPGGHQHT